MAELQMEIIELEVNPLYDAELKIRELKSTVKDLEQTLEMEREEFDMRIAGLRRVIKSLKEKGLK